MVDSIQGLESLAKIAQNASGPDRQGSTDGASFAEIMKKELGEVNQSQIDAQKKVEQLLAGEDIAPEKAMMAVRKSELQFQLLMEIRNKLVESFDEIMRMQI